MDQNIQKALWLGVGVIFFVAIVTTGLFLFNKGKDIAESGGDKIDDMARNLEYAEFAGFDNEVATGADVTNLLSQNRTKSGDFIVVVSTKKVLNYQYISTGKVVVNVLEDELSGKSVASITEEIGKAKNEAEALYINALSDFDCKLIFDANDAVVGVMAKER